MGQAQCCEDASYKQRQLAYKFHNFYQIDPIESQEGKLGVSAVTSDMNGSIAHKPSSKDGSFVQKAPQLNYQVKSRVEQLNGSIMQGNHIVQRGQEQHGYFLFKKTGIVYRGQWKKGKPNGWGQNFYPNGGCYQGSFVDGIPHGFGRLIMPNGDFYEGQIKFGRANGKGFFQTKDGQFKGQFKDNLRHGYGQEKTSSSVFQGEYQFGQKRQGIMKFNGGDIYEGEFQNDLFSGNGTLTTSDGKYTGSFRNGLRNGYGQFKWKDGSYYRGYYIDGQRQGEGEFYNSKNYTTSRGIWKNGTLNGQGQYVQRGKYYRCIWREGKLVGLTN